MKELLIIILYLFSLTVFGQNSGTFKVVKKEREKEEVQLPKYKSNRFFISVESVFAGDSSPELVRDLNLSVGYLLRYAGHRSVYFGILGGNSQPHINYKGTAFGGFAGINSTLHLGPGSISFPLEVSYKRLRNELESPDLNQYIIGLGLGFNPFLFTGMATGSYNENFQLTFLGRYHYDTNAIATFKGVYPTVRLEYRF